jgi:predicted nucleic acid-binding protein
MTSRAPAFLVDTNVIFYAYDSVEGAKQVRAIAVLDRLAATGQAALSVQVLSEFVATITWKPAQPLGRERAEGALTAFIRQWQVLPITPANVLEGARIARQFSLSYWDGLVLATARLAGIPYLLSEDMQDGQLIDGVRILNPFAGSFDMTILA